MYQIPIILHSQPTLSPTLPLNMHWAVLNPTSHDWSSDGDQQNVKDIYDCYVTQAAADDEYTLTEYISITYLHC